MVKEFITYMYISNLYFAISFSESKLSVNFNVFFPFARRYSETFCLPSGHGSKIFLSTGIRLIL